MALMRAARHIAGPARLGLVAALGLIGVARFARADTEGEDFHVPELRSAGRKIIGAGAGIGIHDGLCSGCRPRGGIALEGYGGWQPHRRVALILDAWSTMHFLPADGDNPGVAGYSAITVAAQTWITPILFTRIGAGVGAAYLYSKLADTFDPGPALSITVGGELGHQKASGIDLSLRVSAGPVSASQIADSIFYSMAAMISYHKN